MCVCSCYTRICYGAVCFYYYFAVTFAMVANAGAASSTDL